MDSERPSVFGFLSTLHSYCVTSRHSRSGYGNDEPAAALPIFGLLLKDFLREIPCQEQCEIGLLFQQFFRGINLESRSGCEFALFDRAAIYHEIKRFRTDAAIIQQRASFGRGTIPGDATSSSFHVSQHQPQCRLDLNDAVGKLAIGL